VTDRLFKLPPEQEAIREKCFHPTGQFVEFKKEEIERSIPDRFEKIVRMYPDRVAVKEADHLVTYAELNAMANRLARALVAQQGDEAEPIALLVERGAALLAAMLGVLKAGKFFLVLDPSFSKARIAAMFEDSQARLVVTGRQIGSLTGELATKGCRFMQFQSIDDGISTEDLRLQISSTALVFIFHTSGSTGEPKGIVWTHRNLLHQVMLFTNAYRFCEHDTFALLPAGTANAITTSFQAVLNGAALLPFDVKKDGVHRLANWLLQEKISICPIASPLFRNLCETLTVELGFPDLRFIKLRSEAVYKTDVDLYKRYFSRNCVLANGLSSTETGLLRSYLLDHKTEITGNEVPVGYPVEDKEVLLLDDTGEEVGFNRVGEIVVRSKYLCPGYWNRPDLTQAKFRTDPLGGEERLCFTGDLGLLLPDGCLVHRGRKDHRVKVRGYGVEIAEVEKVLRAHAAVKEAVVAARQNESGEAYLVVYFTTFSKPGPNITDLRNFLKLTLPDYMIPSMFVMLEAIPLTANGKIDRRALPDPGNSRPVLKTAFVPPRTPVEKELARIWAEVLSIDKIGIHDNFFDLGGHSLAATRVISQVIKNFQLEIPLQVLFQAPTVAEMAVVITEHQGKKLAEKELNRILTDLELLSEEEAQRLLAEVGGMEEVKD